MGLGRHLDRKAALRELPSPMAIGSVQLPPEQPKMADGQRVTFLNDDGALVAGVRAQNRLALAALYDRYVGDVRRILLHTLGPRRDLADLVQDVFINVLGSIESLREPSALKGWLFQVTVRTARKNLRHHSRRWWLKLWPGGNELEEEPAWTPNENVSDAVRATFEILDAMDANERMIFALRYIAGLDLSELAQACEISLSTVKRRLARAEQRFHAAAEGSEALRTWAAGGEP